jgi:hypothetical protein
MSPAMMCCYSYGFSTTHSTRILWWRLCTSLEAPSSLLLSLSRCCCCCQVCALDAKRYKELNPTNMSLGFDALSPCILDKPLLRWDGGSETAVVGLPLEVSGVLATCCSALLSSTLRCILGSAYNQRGSNGGNAARGEHCTARLASEARLSLRLSSSQSIKYYCSLFNVVMMNAM